MKVLIPYDIDEAGKAYLRERGYDVVVGSAHDQETIKREIVDADAVIARTDLYRKDVLECAKKLKVIARYGVGLDNIDLEYCAANGIFVTIAKNGNAVSVAEKTVGFILATAQKLCMLDKMTKEGQYPAARNNYPTCEVSGKTLGVLGLGNIGMIVAGMAHFGLNMNIVGFDVFADKMDIPEWIDVKKTMEEVAEVSDIVTIHVPLLPSTVDLFDKKMISRMKDGAIIINCARGGIVNEADLAEALKSGKLGGAGFDVFAKEPPEDDNPLFGCETFVCSPHNAALTVDANRKVSLLAAESIDDVLSGRMPKYPAVKPDAPRAEIKG
ncbi:MAG: hydroxyacid dehydrogenase [Clostridia bacterium]|nr:hydroxyacid dehydrogenase [Clostridia bacterium]